MRWFVRQVRAEADMRDHLVNARWKKGVRPMFGLSAFGPNLTLSRLLGGHHNKDLWV